jgi:hypothetical protein
LFAPTSSLLPVGGKPLCPPCAGTLISLAPFGIYPARPVASFGRGCRLRAVTCPWTPQRIHQAVLRGPHKSARDQVDFVCQEILDFCSQGFWAVLALLPHSPLGVVPQRDRRPLLIVDYTYSHVNQETIRLAPPEAHVSLAEPCHAFSATWCMPTLALAPPGNQPKLTLPGRFLPVLASVPPTFPSWASHPAHPLPLGFLWASSHCPPTGLAHGLD